MSVDKTLKTQLKDYDVQEVAPKIYKINEYNLSTMFVIVGSERALCIDCGTGVGDYKAVIERLVEGKPYDMVLSHGHALLYNLKITSCFDKPNKVQQSKEQHTLIPLTQSQNNN